MVSPEPTRVVALDARPAPDARKLARVVGGLSAEEPDDKARPGALELERSRLRFDDGAVGRALSGAGSDR